MTSRFLAIFLWCTGLIFSISAEPIVEIKQKNVTIREVVKFIEQQTEYRVSLPYADHANVTKKLPPKIELKELLYWICQYFERYNQTKLNFSFDGKNILFNEATSLSVEDQQLILNKKITLNGEQKTINDMIKMVEGLTETTIINPFTDRAQLKADYLYELTLKEFLDEVCNYYKHYNHLQISYAVDKNKIQFLNRGKSKLKDKAPLQVDLLPKQVISTKEMPPEALKIRKESTKEHIKSLPRPAKPKPPPWPFKKQFKRVASFNITDHVRQDSYHDIVYDFTHPHDHNASFKLLYERLTPYMREARGRRDWRKLIFSLDAYPLKPHERNLQIQQLEDVWLKQIFKQQAWLAGRQSGSPTSKYLKTKIYGSTNIGQGASKVGLSPVHRVAKDGYAHWFNAGVSLDYHVKTLRNWIFQYGLDLDTSRRLKGDGDTMEYGSVGLRFQSNRLVAKANIVSVSPYMYLLHEGDIAGAGPIQSHDLFMAGMQIHWAERNKFWGFDKLVSDGDFFVGYNWTKDQESLSPILRKERDTLFPGYFHSWALVKAMKDGYIGPFSKVGLILRDSDADIEDGYEMEGQLGYQFIFQTWTSKTSATYNYWDRNDSVVRKTLAQTFSISPLRRGEKFYLSIEYEHSGSHEATMNYISRKASLGFEYIW